ncbi:MAG: hypothetical protein AAF125_09625 [Chloroflexota bacterium]
MKPKTHTHPNPLQHNIIQYGSAATAALMLVCVPLLLVMAFIVQYGGFLVVGALVVFVLSLPVLMLTAVSPPVTVSADGIAVEPLLWNRRQIAWDDVAAVKAYPLLPTEDTEVNRRTFVGRRNYTPAQGVMLVLPGMPIQYRIAAFFAGEPGRAIIALTNRTHTDYPALIETVERYAGEVQPFD